jgi:hypothetical protein
LDLVNINPTRDFPVYLNPFVFSSRSDPFSIEASRTIASFFQHNLTLIDQGMIDDARANFQHLNEPNETCLGQSRHRPRGRGVGEDNADDLFNSIKDSEAMKTGLVEHLEDTTHGLLGRTSIVAGEIVPVGKETDRHWEQGEDPSLLDFKLKEYRKAAKMVVAAASDRKRWKKFGVRQMIRKSGMSISSYSRIRYHQRRARSPQHAGDVPTGD